MESDSIYLIDSENNLQTDQNEIISNWAAHCAMILDDSLVARARPYLVLAQTSSSMLVIISNWAAHCAMIMDDSLVARARPYLVLAQTSSSMLVGSYMVECLTWIGIVVVRSRGRGNGISRGRGYMMRVPGWQGEQRRRSWRIGNVLFEFLGGITT